MVYKRKKSQYVYIMYCAGYYKIGMTRGTPQGRLRDLQTGNPFTIKIHHYFVSADALYDEALLHDLYAQYRVRGEWFELPDNEVRWLKTIDNLQRSLETRRGTSLLDRLLGR